MWTKCGPSCRHRAWRIVVIGGRRSVVHEERRAVAELSEPPPSTVFPAMRMVVRTLRSRYVGCRYVGVTPSTRDRACWLAVTGWTARPVAASVSDAWRSGWPRSTGNPARRGGLWGATPRHLACYWPPGDGGQRRGRAPALTAQHQRASRKELRTLRPEVPIGTSAARSATGAMVLNDGEIRARARYGPSTDDLATAGILLVAAAEWGAGHATQYGRPCARQERLRCIRRAGSLRVATSSASIP